MTRYSVSDGTVKLSVWCDSLDEARELLHEDILTQLHLDRVLAWTWKDITQEKLWFLDDSYMR